MKVIIKKITLCFFLFILVSSSALCVTLNPYLVTQTSTVEKDQLFSVTTGVTCNGGTCTGIVAKLDPKPQKENTEYEIDEILKHKKTAQVIINLKEEQVSDNKPRKQQIEEKQNIIIDDMKDSSFFLKQLFSNEPVKFKVRHKYNSVNAISATISKKGFEELKVNPDVESIEPDRVAFATLIQSIPQINADDYWNMIINSTNIKGSGQTVCIVDTGINSSHPGFEGRVIAEKCYCSYGGDCCPDHTSEDEAADDDNGHGTHCAGIVAADYGSYKGVAPEANIVAVKVLNSAGQGYTSDIVAGIDWCVANKDTYNISVISLSLGGSTTYSSDCDGSNPTFANAISAAVAANIAVFAASGNDADHTGISSPACVSDAISVGAVYDAAGGGIGWSSCTDTSRAQDQLTCFTNSAANLDILAPGALITSLDYAGTTSVKGGTSMACPMAAGAAALIKDYYKTKYNYSITPAEIEQKLKLSGKPIDDPFSTRYYPRINLENVVEKGVIPELSDWNGVDPFYTISSNPENDSCLASLSDGQSCNSTWLINATQTGTWEFFTIYEEDDEQVFTQKFNITVVISQPEIPKVTLYSPIDQLIVNPDEINFTYKVNSSLPINSCSLFVDDIQVDTSTNVINNTFQTLNWTSVSGGKHKWGIVCTNNESRSNELDNKTVFVTLMTNFSGDSTNISEVPDIEDISNLIIEKPEYGKINFSVSVNLSGGADINDYVTIEKNRIEVDSDNIPQLNKSAVLILRGIYMPNPVILRNGVICDDCVIIDSSRDYVKFQVNHFSTYTVSESSIGASGQYNSSPAVPENITTQGGNVTWIDLQTNTTTIKWQGYYGTLFGKLVLGLAGEGTFYDFGTLNVTSIYASQNATFDFANKASANVNEVDTAFGFNTALDVDQTVDVFTELISIDGLINAPATTLHEGRFRCYIADDSSPTPLIKNLAFGAEINNSGEVGFEGSTLDYELIVPVEGVTTPTYYFFMSI